MNLKSGIFLLFLLPLIISPSSTALIAPDTYNIQGSNSYYQVVMDERGQALVLNRIEFMNLKKDSITEITLEIPGTSANFKYALQGLIGCSQYCAQYETQCTDMRKVCDVWDYNQNDCITWRDECLKTERTCARYEERCSLPTNYAASNYKLIDVQKISANTFTLKLSKPVESEQRGVLLLSYRVFGYVNDGFTKDFDFQTIKYPFDIDHTRVAISVDKDLYLKGGESRTDYVTGFNAFESQMMGASKTSALSESTLDYSVRNIQYATGYVKEKSNLLPYEVFHVAGSYADASWKVNLFEWLFWVIIILLAIFLIVKFALPMVGKVFESVLPADNKKGRGKEIELNAGRAVTAGILSATIYALIAAFLIFISFLFDTTRIFRIGSGEVLLMLLILLGIVSVIILFLFVNFRYNITEAVISTIVFVGFAAVMTPAIAFVLLLLISLLSSGRMYF